MEYFDRLGHLTSDLWRKVGFNEDCFPEIAVRAFRELPPHEWVTVEDILHWTLGRTRLPLQPNLGSAFGQPPITVFYEERFYIDVYFWMDSTTSIHQHGFNGAFSVLAGSSLHSRFEFDTEQMYGRRLKKGLLHHREMTLLTKGSAIEILSGTQFIHSLFHLERPSVTVVIRSGAPWDLPQYNYWWPYLAMEPPDAQLLTRKIQLLNMMVAQQHGDLHSLLMRYLPMEDPYSMIHLLDHGRRGYQGKNDLLRELFNMIEVSFPSLFEALPPVYIHRTNSQKLLQLRTLFHDPDMRFFLALLLNIRDPRQLRQMVLSRYPDMNPEDVILKRIRETAEASHPNQPNALDMTLTPFREKLLCLMLTRSDGDETPQKLAAEIGQGGLGDSTESLEDALKAIRSATPFKIIFSKAPST